MASSNRPALRKLNAIFEKRRRIWRSPRDGPAQLLERLVAASGGGERRAKQGLGDRIFAAARSPFQRRDGLGAAVLHQQRMAEDLRRAGVAAVGLQQLGGDVLGLVGTLHLQRQTRAFERLVIGVRPSRDWKEVTGASTSAPMITKNPDCASGPAAGRHPAVLRAVDHSFAAVAQRDFRCQ